MFLSKNITMLDREERKIYMGRSLKPSGFSKEFYAEHMGQSASHLGTSDGEVSTMVPCTESFRKWVLLM